MNFQSPETAPILEALPLRVACAGNAFFPRLSGACLGEKTVFAIKLVRKRGIYRTEAVGDHQLCILILKDLLEQVGWIA